MIDAPPKGLSRIPSFLEGVYIGLNAVPDVYMILDAPFGCLLKLEKLGLNHDLTSNLLDPLGHNRVVTTYHETSEVALGTAKLIRKAAHLVCSKASPRALLISEVTASSLALTDYASLSKEIEQQVKIPVKYLGADHLNGDFVDGFEAFVRCLCEVVTELTHQSEPSLESVGIIGLFADRLERDWTAGVEQIKNALKCLGLDAKWLMCGGDTLDKMVSGANVEYVIEFPLSTGAGDGFQKKFSSKVIGAELPIGIRKSIDFLTRIGEVSNRQEKARALIHDRVRAVLPFLDRVKEQFLFDKGVAIFATYDMVVPLASFMQELGMRVELVGVRTRHEEKAKQVIEGLSELGMKCNVIYDYSEEELVQALNNADSVDVVLGSTMEAVSAYEIGAGFVEIGYPSYRTHALYPRPFFLFEGTLRLAEEIVNAFLMHMFEKRCRQG